MKIIFLCGSLEPSCDGVGDYTRRLSGELIRQGRAVSIIALYDRSMSVITHETQRAEDIPIETLRIPFLFSIRLRTAEAKKCINKFNPDWLSLQFVPSSFHLKGLPFNLRKILLEVGKGRSWHIMFHELWIGMNVEAPLKYLLWGWVQKQLVKSLIKNLSGPIISTQTHLYIKQLKKLGFEAQFLPLFSNVQNHIGDKNFVLQELNFKEIPKKLIFVLFGSIHPNAPIEEFAKNAAEYGRQKGVAPSLLFLGRCGKEQARWVSTWESNGLLSEVFGEQPEHIISEVLSRSTFGITTTPIVLVEKSGSVAAMREHGLPVLCISSTWTPRGFKNIQFPLDILEYKTGNLGRCLSYKISRHTKDSVCEVADQFTKRLYLNNNG